jgi:hypothetical protein
MLVELGHESDVVGVARLYRDFASVLVVDSVDAHLASAVEAAGMRCVVTDTIMNNERRRAARSTWRCSDGQAGFGIEGVPSQPMTFGTRRRAPTA